MQVTRKPMKAECKDADMDVEGCKMGNYASYAYDSWSVRRVRIVRRVHNYLPAGAATGWWGRSLRVGCPRRSQSAADLAASPASNTHTDGQRDERTRENK
jgi:hypothetical protein